MQRPTLSGCAEMLFRKEHHLYFFSHIIHVGNFAKWVQDAKEDILELDMNTWKCLE